MERENESFQKQNKQIIEEFDSFQKQNKQIIGEFDWEIDGLKKSLTTSKIQKLKLERELVVFQARYIYLDSKLLGDIH